VDVHELVYAGDPNAALWWVIGGTTCFGPVLYVPFLRDLFRLSTPHADDLALCPAVELQRVMWWWG
jgi:Ca2+-transporting ATPase